MNLESIISIITQFLLLPLLPLIATCICSYIKKCSAEIEEKTSNAYIEKYLAVAQGVLVQVVSTVTETYVKELKQQNKFGKEEQLKAMRKAVCMFNAIINDECKKLLEELYGDYTAWIETRIEDIIASGK